jgi:hypothetical protein
MKPFGNVSTSRVRILVALAAMLPTPLLAQIGGVVFVDSNANGVRDAGEPGRALVTVSNQIDVSVTDSAGRFSLPSPGTGVVFVSVPDGFRSTAFWRRADAANLAFSLTPVDMTGELTLVHASDTHIQASSIPRVTKLRSILDSVRANLVLVTGDLTRDALRVSEPEARGYYELYRQETARITIPVWSVPGNHELFGIERHLSLVSRTHPLYGRGMYRHYLGPDYYSFNAGGIHFVGLNTVDNDDLWYYGHVDSTQLAWLRRDLATVPPNVQPHPFCHRDAGPRRVRGRTAGADPDPRARQGPIPARGFEPQ